MASKVGSFATYLDTLHSAAATRQADASSAFNVLVTLAQGTHSLADLQRTSGLTFGDFAQAVEWLREQGFVVISGPPGNETTTLTPAGQTVASLAKATKP
jgi:hypothetical protein